jgi:hypothetical protein
MIRRLFRLLFRFALVLGAGAALYKVAQARRPSPVLPPDPTWTPKARREPSVPAPAAVTVERDLVLEESAVVVEVDGDGAASEVADVAAEVPPADAAWVEPQDGACPVSHPVKAKMSSKIFHAPGMTAYERTNADRCYRDEEAAEADGLRKAKR